MVAVVVGFVVLVGAALLVVGDVVLVDPIEPFEGAAVLLVGGEVKLDEVGRTSLPKTLTLRDVPFLCVPILRVRSTSQPRVKPDVKLSSLNDIWTLEKHRNSTQVRTVTQNNLWSHVVISVVPVGDLVTCWKPDILVPSDVIKSASKVFGSERLTTDVRMDSDAHHAWVC